MLPYQNQQVGGTLGGPIVKDKLHYFGSYEYEREPGTTFSTPSALPGRDFHDALQELPAELAGARRRSAVAERPPVGARVALGLGEPVCARGRRPSVERARMQTKQATNVLGTWSNVMSNTKVQEVRVGYNNFQWANRVSPRSETHFNTAFPGLTIGKPYNYPQWLNQNNWSPATISAGTRTKHDFKIGGEYIYAHDGALVHRRNEGFFTFTSVPGDITAHSRRTRPTTSRPGTWRAGCDGARSSRRTTTADDWTIDVPRPTWAVWFGDNWRLRNQLTINYGVRWDDDWNVASPPDIVTNSIPINNGSAAAATRIPGMTAAISATRRACATTDIAPRAGFTWNVGGANDLVDPRRQRTLLRPIFERSPTARSSTASMITASFVNDGTPGFVADPARGVTTYDQAAAAAPPQAARIITPDFRNPYTWQSSIGFQKQMNA